eukprot:3849707-Pyramimonas_sp.AAC.1
MRGSEEGGRGLGPIGGEASTWNRRGVVDGSAAGPRRGIRTLLGVVGLSGPHRRSVGDWGSMHPPYACPPLIQ